MSDWFAIEAIDEAIEETKDLLSPFDVREWFTLAVVILFTGGAGGFQLMNALVRGIGALSGAAGEGGSTASMHQTSLTVGELTGVTGMAPSARVSLLVGLVTLTFFALVVAWFFVSAVMNFVFVDICRRKDVGI
ncbi:MAG: hypothetical protein SVU32_06850, partial [Candidatus Nanohaloarchaea archaeon]|nr:hypothetical protein [Candidatus Nanohaloarchaea archaeon]